MVTPGCFPLRDLFAPYGSFFPTDHSLLTVTIRIGMVTSQTKQAKASTNISGGVHS